MADKLKKKGKAKRRTVAQRVVRFNASLNVKVEKPKKAALVKYAGEQKRSYAFFVQQMLDEFIEAHALVIPTSEEADAILAEALNG